MQEIRLPITIALTIELNVVTNHKTDIVSGTAKSIIPTITSTPIDETLKQPRIVIEKESGVVYPVRQVLEKTTDECARDLHTEVTRGPGRPKGSFRNKNHVWNKPHEYDRGFRPEVVLKTEIITCANVNCCRKLRFLKGTGVTNKDYPIGEFCNFRCFEDYEAKLKNSKNEVL